MIVVSNTSPLTNLAAIQQFWLLHALFGEIHIPSAVWTELNANGQSWPGHREVESALWVTRHPVRNTSLITALRLQLDQGEAEAIALALELGSSIVLMDEKDGRRIAKRYGLHIMGVLGILVQAKREHLIEAVLPLVDQLRQTAGFYLNDSVLEAVRTLANE